jgi:succinate dehydrogenase / fumarate reductase iron-sulfur subunit
MENTILLEPKAFPVIKDLVWTEAHLIEFSRWFCFDQYLRKSYRCKCNSNPKHDADRAFDACIGCGACVASCKTLLRCYLFRLKYHNMLLPQGKIEAADRVLNMVAQMDAEGFGNCTNTGACEVGVQRNISRKHRTYEQRIIC